MRLNDLKPNNLQVEKEKFFASNTNYNPQFQYSKQIKPADLQIYGKPRWRYCQLAKKIIKQAQQDQLFINDQQKNSNLDQEVTRQIIIQYLKDYNLFLKYRLLFDEEFTSRFAVNFKENLIKIRLPINFSRESLIYTLNHEIATHILRQENYLHQEWYHKKNHYGFSNHLRTEEGLAVIHQYLNQSEQLIYKTALSYLGVKVANETDFKTLYRFFDQYVNNANKSWSYALKIKRGLTDSSRPGGFSKSLVYLEGFEKVLKYLHRHQYNPSDLYYGKLAIADIAKAKKMKPDYQPVLPKFYTDDPSAYRKQIISLAKRNYIF